MNAADDEQAERDRMVALIRQLGVLDSRVLDAMRRVPRHRFIPAAGGQRGDPYGDHPLPIGAGQTMSQPYIVAYMTAALNLAPGDRVLDIGTGSGYQAAVFAELGLDVYSIEIIPALARHARERLAELGYGQVHVVEGDGRNGLPEYAPYRGMLAACAPATIPDGLLAQLAPDGGRLILPVGIGVQRLAIVENREGQIHRRLDLPVRFVPMLESPPSCNSSTSGS